MKQSSTTQRVLLIDDDPTFVAQVRESLHRLADLRVVDDATSALRANLFWRPDLIIIDALLAQGDAFELLDEVRAAREGDAYGVVYLAKGRGACTQYQQTGDEVFGIMVRDFDSENLSRQIKAALELTRSAREQVA